MSFLAPGCSDIERNTKLHYAGAYGAPLIVTSREPGIQCVEYQDPTADDPNQNPIARMAVSNLLYNPGLDPGIEVTLILDDGGLSTLAPGEIESVAVDHPDADMLPLDGQYIPPLAVLSSFVGVSALAASRGVVDLVQSERLSDETKMFTLGRCIDNKATGRASAILMTGFSDGGAERIAMTSSLPGEKGTAGTPTTDDAQQIVYALNHPDLDLPQLGAAHSNLVEGLSQIGMQISPALLQFNADIALLGMTRYTLPSLLA